MSDETRAMFMIRALFAPNKTTAVALETAREFIDEIDRRRPGWRAGRVSPGRTSKISDAHRPIYRERPVPRLVNDLLSMWSLAVDEAKELRLEANRRGGVDPRELVQHGIGEANMRDACLGLLDDIEGWRMFMITAEDVRQSKHWDRLRDHLTASIGKGPSPTTAIVRAVWRHASAVIGIDADSPAIGVVDRGSRWAP